LHLSEIFHVSHTAALLPYSFYVFGQAWGPYILLFSLFTLGAGLSNSLASLVVCRFFAGVFGSPALSVGGGTVADVWAEEERAVPMAVLVLVPFLGPSLG